MMKTFKEGIISCVKSWVAQQV